MVRVGNTILSYENLSIVTLMSFPRCFETINLNISNRVLD